MSNLLVIEFYNEYGAGDMRDALADMQKQELVELDDYALVVRKMEGKVEVKKATNLVGAGGRSAGRSWGMLIGLLFLAPWIGLAVGVITGGLAGKFTDLGIDDNFIKEVGSSIAPGNSAIFLLVRQAVVDKVILELREFNGRIIQTSPSREKEEHLREALSAEQEKVEVAKAPTQMRIRGSGGFTPAAASLSPANGFITANKIN